MKVKLWRVFTNELRAYAQATLGTRRNAMYPNMYVRIIVYKIKPS